MSDLDILKEQFVPRYQEIGETGFYQFLIFYGMNRLVEIEKKTYNGIHPNLEFLSLHDKFITLYRREGENIYLEMARLFRKAGHKIYRIMLKKSMIKEDRKFLTLVK